MMAEPAVVGASPEKKSLRLEAPHGGRPRLLLAEDCDPVRIVTAAMLKGMGCDVEAVIHGEEEQSLAFAEALREDRPKAEVIVPVPGQAVDFGMDAAVAP